MPAQEFGLLRQRLLLGQGKVISLRSFGNAPFLLKFFVFGFGNNAFVFVTVETNFFIINLVIAKHAIVSSHFI
jgi:hypothetical protein